MNLRDARLKKGFSQNDLAFAARVPQAEISRLENGKSWPYPAYRKRLSLVLGVSERELFPEVFKEGISDGCASCG